MSGTCDAVVVFQAPDAPPAALRAGACDTVDTFETLIQVKVEKE